MAKRRKRESKRERRARQSQRVDAPSRGGMASSRKPPRDWGAAIAAAALIGVLVFAGLGFDSGADSSFDAPKRLTTLLGVAVASAAALGFCRWKNPFRSEAQSFSRRLTLFLLLAALAGGLVAALLSPRRALSLDALRALCPYILLLALGASRVLEKRRTLLLSVFLGVTAVNALVSILQARGLYHPFPLQVYGGREATGAFVGNVGYLALALALAAVAALGLALTAQRVGLRVLAWAGLLLFAAGLLANQNLTAVTALVAGAAILLFSLYGRRALLPIAAGLLALGIGIALYPPMRQRAREAAAAARAGNWDRLLTYRLGPWAAALEMTRERPWAGWGPGTFGAEFVSHRLTAEIRARKRFYNPLVTSSYVEAHCDYLQPLAEAGIPAGLAALAAVVLLFRGLWLATRKTAGSRNLEAILLLAFLGAGAAAALTWFPLQRPISAVPLLLAAGRAWRIGGRESEGEPA